MRDTKNAAQSLKRGFTTNWIMSRHNHKKTKVWKLRREIIELERQLKQHPLGAIILKATIKQKQIEMKNLNFIPIKSGGNRKNRGNY